jgi:hypothetical protein
MTEAIHQRTVDWFLTIPGVKPEEIQELKERNLIKIKEENNDGN